MSKIARTKKILAPQCDPLTLCSAMGRARALTQFERRRITEPARSGQSFHAIGGVLGRSDKVVRNFLSDPEQYDF